MEWFVGLLLGHLAGDYIFQDRIITSSQIVQTAFGTFCYRPDYWIKKERDDGKKISNHSKNY